MLVLPVVDDAAFAIAFFLPQRLALVPMHGPILTRSGEEFLGLVGRF